MVPRGAIARPDRPKVSPSPPDFEDTCRAYGPQSASWKTHEPARVSPGRARDFTPIRTFLRPDERIPAVKGCGPVYPDGEQPQGRPGADKPADRGGQHRHECAQEAVPRGPCGVLLDPVPRGLIVGRPIRLGRGVL